jgi:hypothetical protein
MTEQVSEQIESLEIRVQQVVKEQVEFLEKTGHIVNKVNIRGIHGWDRSMNWFKIPIEFLEAEIKERSMN